MLTGFFILIILMCLAMMMGEGMWSSAIRSINVTLSAMIATNYFEPIAAYLDRQVPSYTYIWDFLLVWALFVLCFNILRLTTDNISKYRVRFRLPVEMTGRILVPIFTGWVLVCFTCMTLHMAPLAQTAFRDSFAKEPKSASFLGLAPDRLWLGFIQSRSQGVLSSSGQTFGSPDPNDQDKNVFDARGEFIYKYGARRQALYNHMKVSGSVRVRRR